ncbi:hypothetical protein [Micromonospora sp. RP3T]|uniref:hypothetical protein n=1 Tax=Micromonospora sp. RP3T TaxID=2135446 RepID=UPI000D15615B|nr:hypothetical protein [Micromonospora sp. RP3T]PTA43970.1 hypothetical protein C8054_22730 [Micromonospora sp. RP3T]
MRKTRGSPTGRRRAVAPLLAVALGAAAVPFTLAAPASADIRSCGSMSVTTQLQPINGTGQAMLTIHVSGASYTSYGYRFTGGAGTGGGNGVIPAFPGDATVWLKSGPGAVTNWTDVYLSSGYDSCTIRYLVDSTYVA